MTTDARDIRENDDDGFHEIQLSGKQLVFLCMATTVVSIVIFLCGVLVGRGVRPVEAIAEASSVAATDPSAADAPADAPPAGGASAAAPAANEPTPTPDVPPNDEPAAKPTPAPAAASSAPAPTAAVAVNTPPPAPAPAVVKKPEPAKPDVAAAKPATPPAATPAPAAAAANKEADTPKPAAAEAPAAPAPAAASKGGQIAVQVGAYRERSEADVLAKKLTGKGYAVYIVSPDANAANPMFRVRVGNYTSQDEASRVKRRLEQEEKLKPWIIR